MKIEHAALWTNDLEKMKGFYETFFNAKANEKYVSTTEAFESYFLAFESGTRLEIMKAPELVKRDNKVKSIGYQHLAFSVGTKEEVDKLTKTIKEAGYEVLREPRQTGDGYYESCIFDPDGNEVEITI